MKDFKELTVQEQQEIAGGASFGYRIGQLIAMTHDIFVDGTLNGVAGLTAAEDWFG